MTKDRTDSAYLGVEWGMSLPQSLKEQVASLTRILLLITTSLKTSPSVYYVLSKYNETLNLTVKEDKHYKTPAFRVEFGFNNMLQ